MATVSAFPEVSTGADQAHAAFDRSAGTAYSAFKYSSVRGNEESLFWLRAAGGIDALTSTEEQIFRNRSYYYKGDVQWIDVHYQGSDSGAHVVGYTVHTLGYTNTTITRSGAVLAHGNDSEAPLRQTFADELAIDLLAGGATGAGRRIAARGIRQEITVYRVEGAVNQRVVIDAGRDVTLEGEKMLFVNFGSPGRADAFLARRLEQGLGGVTVKEWSVKRSFLARLRESAVPERLASEFPDAPIVVDATKATNQFGLRPEQIAKMRRAILRRSGWPSGDQ